MLRPLLAAVLTLAALGCGSTSRQAPSPSRDRVALPAPPSLEEQLAELDTRLDLTEPQEQSVRSALDIQAEALAAAGRLPDLRSRRTAAERARTEADSRIAAALTSVQRQVFDEIRAERGPVYDASVERRLALLRQRLHLTADQEALIGPILEQQTAELEPLIRRARRDREQREDAVAQIQALQERTDASILDLLTEEQARDFRALREEQRANAPGRRQRRG